MKNLRYLFLIFAFGFFALGKAQSAATTKPKNKLSYGIQSSAFFLQLLDYYNNQQKIYGSNYNGYLQYKNLGVFGGYTALYNSGFYWPNGATVNCFSAGLFFKMAEFNKANKLYVYLYNIHCSGLIRADDMLIDPSTYPYHPRYVKQALNFLTFSPRYRASFCKNILSVEVGVFVSFMFDTPHPAIDNPPAYPACGATLGLGLNVAALFKKK
jgi:hypothetical protein